MDNDQGIDREQPRGAEPPPGGAQQVDVRALAERVYRLMRDEIRLARARGQQPAAGKE